jgi:tetratricopeptide (TPR) repeat protein
MPRHKAFPPKKGDARHDAQLALVVLFSQGRYEEAATVAQRITLHFPYDGFAWKVLGSAYQQMGRTTAALVPLQRAANCTPEDAEAYSNLGTVQSDLRRLHDARGCYRLALAIKPDFAAAHFNLGNAARDLVQAEAAETSYRHALHLAPDYAAAYNNLGNTLRALGRLDEAETNCRWTLAIKPDYAEACNNLGIIRGDQGKSTAAEADFRRALRVDPFYADAYYNLGNALLAFDRTAEAQSCFRRTLQIKPDYCDALVDLAQTFYFADEIERAVAYYEKAVNGDAIGGGARAAVDLAILQYMKGDSVKSKMLLSRARSILLRDEHIYQGYKIYWKYLTDLHSWHDNNDNKGDKLSNLFRLYAIGDSHSLSAQGVGVSYNDLQMRCTAEWMIGCKQWHLGSELPNKYKRKFEAIMSRLPQKSTVLMLIGEIDCRYNDGIQRVLKKHKEREMGEIVRSTTDLYTSYVYTIAQLYGHKLIIGGVPCTNWPLEQITSVDADQLVALIRVFNLRLKTAALMKGMDFLDLYALTDRGDGIASGKKHIDDVHLLPSALREAFEKYCVRSEMGPE